MTIRLNPAFLFYLGYGLLLALCLYFFVGCASTLTVRPDGTVIAKDYTVSIKADGTRTYAPNRWFTTGFLNNLFGGLIK